MLLKLKMKRMERGLTQEEMAEKLGISIIAYHHKENGQNDFKLSEIKLLLEILDTTYEEIFN